MGEIDYEAAALSLIEAELGWGLMSCRRTEVYRADMRIPLKAWPVQEVHAITPLGHWIEEPDGAELLAGSRLDADAGILALPGLKDAQYQKTWRQWRERAVTEVTGPCLEITYTGGYGLLPAALETAKELLIQALKSTAANNGQQITFEALDGYQVTYSSRYQDGTSLTMLSPAAAILIAPFRREYRW